MSKLFNIMITSIKISDDEYKEFKKYTKNMSLSFVDFIHQSLLRFNTDPVFREDIIKKTLEYKVKNKLKNTSIDIDKKFSIL